MKSGAVLFAVNVERVAAFYEALVPMSPVHIEPGLRVIASDGAELVIHAIPPHIMSADDLATPPIPREDCAVKLYFVVASLAAARARAPALGGWLHECEREFEARRFRACDGCDPEGNVIQFRELLLQPT